MTIYFSYKMKLRSTFFALSAQQEAKHEEIELGRWTTGVGVGVTWIEDRVWVVGWACTLPIPLSPPPPPLATALPVVSRVRQLDVESPRPSATVQPCCCSHPEIYSWSAESSSHGIFVPRRRYFYPNLCSFAKGILDTDTCVFSACIFNNWTIIHDYIYINTEGVPF